MSESRKRNKVEDDESDKQFHELESILKAFDEKREQIIKKSRDIQKAAKQAIYSLHRQDYDKANSLLQQCEKISQPELFNLVKEDPELRYGSFAGALEEYSEAVLFRHYLINKSNCVPFGFKSFTEQYLPINAEEYLGGLMDCCGEVQRYAVMRATKGDLQEVQRAREYVDYVMGRVMLFDFRNGNLRKKSDTIKWVLKRLEEVLFDLSVGGRFKDEPVAVTNMETSDANHNE